MTIYQRPYEPVHNQNINFSQPVAWLSKAEQSGINTNKQFIYYWLALTSFFDQVQAEQSLVDNGRRTRPQIIDDLVKIDNEHLIEHVIEKQYHDSITVLFDTRLTFEPYWAYRSHLITRDEWVKYVTADNKCALAALKNGQTAALVSMISCRVDIFAEKMMQRKIEHCLLESLLKNFIGILSGLMASFLSIASQKGHIQTYRDTHNELTVFHPLL